MATALNELTSMPSLPVTSGIKAKAKERPGYIGGKELGPALEELRGAETAAEQKIGEADIAIEKARREEKGIEAGKKAELYERIAEEQKALPERAEYQAAQESLGEMKFVPTRDTVEDLAGLFGLVGVIGMVTGKGNALNAMSAMNGMLEGHRKGRADLFKQQQAEFDKNFKAMQTKVQTLEKKLSEAMALKNKDREAGELKIQQAIAESESPLLKAMKDKQGDVAVLNAVRGARKDLETVVAQENKLQEAADRRAAQEARMQMQRELAELRAQGTAKATQQQFIAQRAVNALGGVASSMESISRLPAGTNIGVLGNLTTKDGMANYIRNSAARKVTSSEAKAMETLFSGITRNLATIEASGTATGLVSLATQLEKLRPVAGDTAYDVALKLADIRRVATENIIPLISSGLMPPQQAQTAAQLVRRVEEAIPYTTDDVVNALPRRGKTMVEAGMEIGEKGQMSEAQRKRLQELEAKEKE